MIILVDADTDFQRKIRIPNVTASTTVVRSLDFREAETADTAVMASLYGNVGAV